MSAFKPTACAPPETSATMKNADSRYRVQWWQMLLLMTLLSVVLAFVFCPRCGVLSTDFVASFLFSFFYATGLWLVNSYPAKWLRERANWKQHPLRSFLLTMLYSITASVAVIVLVNSLMRYFFFGRPLLEVFTPSVMASFVFPMLMTVVITLFLHSRSFLLGWRDTAIQAERLEKENAQAQADSLRRQLDPHFLFNSLNVLTTLVEEQDPARATRFIRQLSQVYRYVLDSQAQEVVPLREELRFVDSYLHLQRTRLGAGLHVEMHLPPAAALDAFLVPPLAVQLLLENALKHNATSQRDPLHMEVKVEPAARRLYVCNTLRPRTVAPGESTGLGLQNLQARYAFLSSQPVQVERTPTEFRVTLPLLSFNN